MEALSSPKLQESQEKFDTINMILEAYCDKYVEPNLNRMLKSWIASYGKEDAVECIFHVINDSTENLEEYLDKNYDIGEAHKFTKDVLINLCCHANGEIADDEYLIKQCKAISTLLPSEIKIHAGAFFREKMNGFLQQEYPDEYHKIITPSATVSFASCSTAFANDNMLGLEK